jgi:hypothetical protein
MFETPADRCPHCKANLRDATFAKRRKGPLWRRIVSWIMVLLCGWAIYVLLDKLVMHEQFEVLKSHLGIFKGSE